MSNVIKRFALTLTEPMIISCPQVVVVEPEPEIVEPEPDSERIRKEMANIIRETECMVKDLMDKAGEEARSILEEAREDAEILKNQAFKEAEEIKQQAQKEGYEHGLREAQKEIEADRQMALEQCQQILEEARRSKLKILESSTADMARLAMAVAKKVISAEVNTNPQIIIKVIRDAINLLDQPGNIHVYVNPQEIEAALAGISAEELSEMEKQELINALTPDARVRVGGCVIESDAGMVDAQLDTRIAKVEQALQDVTVDESTENI